MDGWEHVLEDGGHELELGLLLASLWRAKAREDEERARGEFFAGGRERARAARRSLQVSSERVAQDLERQCRATRQADQAQIERRLAVQQPVLLVLVALLAAAAGSMHGRFCGWRLREREHVRDAERAAHRDKVTQPVALAFAQPRARVGLHHFSHVLDELACALAHMPRAQHERLGHFRS